MGSPHDDALWYAQEARRRDPGRFHDALKNAGLEYSGFSCDGINLFGDSKSIEALKRWHHEAGTVPQLKDEILRLRSLHIHKRPE